MEIGRMMGRISSSWWQGMEIMVPVEIFLCRLMMLIWGSR